MEEWRQCGRWLIDCKVLPPNHRVVWPSAAVFDLAQALRDGVLLCQMLHNLSPGSVDLKEINFRPQMSQVRLQLPNLQRDGVDLPPLQLSLQPHSHTHPFFLPHSFIHGVTITAAIDRLGWYSDLVISKKVTGSTHFILHDFLHVLQFPPTAQNMHYAYWRLYNRP